MTVASTASRIAYNCDGSAYVFPFTFKAYAKGDLVVVLADAAGAETTLTVDVQYEVALSSPGPGGDVTLLSQEIAGVDYLYGTSVPFPVPSGYALVIYRRLPRTQLIDIDDGDRLPADTVEEGYDRAVMLIQELEEVLDRVVKLKVSSALTGIVLPDPVAARYLRWNDAGDNLENMDISTITGAESISDYGKTLIDDPDAAAARKTLGIDPASPEVVWKNS
jgi:hypothetical protein